MVGRPPSPDCARGAACVERHGNTASGRSAAGFLGFLFPLSKGKSNSFRGEMRMVAEKLPLFISPVAADSEQNGKALSSLEE